jgi:protein TonB
MEGLTIVTGGSGRFGVLFLRECVDKTHEVTKAMSVRASMNVIGKRLLWVSLLAAAAGAAHLYAGDGTVRVSEADLKKAAITKVKPDFPPLARQLHLSGHAQLDVFVGATGDVEKVEPKSGNPLFTGAAATALRKLKFTPFKSDGQPVKAVGTLEIDFALQ